MANPYFNFTSPVVPGTRIVSARYNQDLSAIAAAFDVLPASDELYLTLLGYGPATGLTPNVYNVTIPVGAPLVTYVTGMQVTFLANKTSTGAAQVNVNGLGNKLIVSSGSVSLPAGSIIAGSYYTMRYDGTNFQMQTALYALFDQSAAAAAASAAAALVSQNAAAASALAAAGSASAAAGSATTASTQATNAATSASQALGYRNTAQTAATTATTQAGNASGSATAAATSATNAANSATAAATSATNAANSATAASGSATSAANSAASAATFDPALYVLKSGSSMTGTLSREGSGTLSFNAYRNNSGANSYYGAQTTGGQISFGTGSGTNFIINNAQNATAAWANISAASATFSGALSAPSLALTAALPVSSGGTGATDAPAARTNLGAKADVGITDGSSAAAGVVGEVITGQASGITPTNNNVFNGAALTLTPGDWEVSAIVEFVATGSVTSTISGTSTANAVSQGFPYNSAIFGNLGAGTHRLAAPVRRFNVTSNTIVYSIGAIGFTSGSVTAQGSMYARRIR